LPFALENQFFPEQLHSDNFAMLHLTRVVQPTNCNTERWYRQLKIVSQAVNLLWTWRLSFQRFLITLVAG